MQPFAAEMSYSDKPRGVFRSPSKARQAGTCCSAMSLSRVMNTLQEIMVLLTGYIDYSSQSFGDTAISHIPLAFKWWKDI